MNLAVRVSLAGLIVIAASTASAQSGVELRELLLRPTGWIFEWKLGLGSNVDSTAPGASGNGEMMFQVRGGPIIVAIDNKTLGLKCERPATLSGTTVLYNGCLDIGIVLQFDPADRDYPLKGANADEHFEYRLKVK